MDYSYNLDLKKYNNPGNLLLVPNQRLCRKLIQYNFDKELNVAQHSLYITTRLNIFSLNDFIDNIFTSLLESGKLMNLEFGSGYPLTKLQRETIFKEIIKQSSDENIEYSNSFSANLVVRKVVQAWELVQQWELDWSSWLNYLQPEAVLFSSWAKKYVEHLHDHNYIDIEQKVIAIRDLLDTDKSIIELLQFKNIDLYGFDEIQPLTAKIFQQLNTYNVIVNKIDQKPILNSTVKLHIADTIEQEINNAANWAYTNYKNNQSLLNIGIIVPNLANYRSLFVRSFEEIIPDRSLWNISGGEYLHDIPVIRVALFLLELIGFKQINIDNLNYLLRSEYYLKLQGTGNDNIDLLLIELQVQGYHELHEQEIIDFLLKVNPALAHIIDYFFNPAETTIKLLDAELSRLNLFLDGAAYTKIRQLSETLKTDNLGSKWAVVFSDVLAILGWPAGSCNIINSNNLTDLPLSEKVVNSHDYQAIGQWQACCQQLGQLDLVLGSIEIQRTIIELKNILLSTPFQIETDNNKIDVLGMLEGAGLMYHKLWLFNMSSELWPAIPDPNPFIPVDLQRKYLLPHSTAHRELEYAQKLTDRYLSSSIETIISYSKNKQDTENRLSLLFEKSNFDLITNAQFKQKSDKLEVVENHKVNIIKIVDDTGPGVIDSHAKIHIKSGVKALNLQAVCPFRAFTEVRLGAERERVLDIGPPLWLRGLIIHDVLEKLYSQYNNKNKITNYIKHGDYFTKLNELILMSLNKFKLKYNNIFKSGIVKIEQEIIFKIVDNFLNIEIDRDDFSIIAVEEKCLIKINNIQFEVRVDRVDRLDAAEDDSTKIIIIDYKTARQNIAQLLNDELFDVQLPIYAFLDKFDNAEAVIFAEVLEVASQYNGIGKAAVLDGCIAVDDWDGLKTKWKNNIKILANSFTKGNAQLNIDPQICRSCHLSGLCRKDQSW